MELKIIMLNGSPRKTGATAKVLEEFKNHLKKCGDVDIITIHLSDIKMDYCKGCCSCYQTGTCITNDDAERLSQTISEADGLIVASPNYVSGISGQLKTFVDRGHFVIEQLLLLHRFNIEFIRRGFLSSGNAAEPQEC